MNIVRLDKDNQWVRLDGSEAVVGITDYAKTRLGEVVHIDLPRAGKRIEQSKEAAAVESVKVANDIYAPISGEVTSVNTTGPQGIHVGFVIIDGQIVSERHRHLVKERGKDSLLAPDAIAELYLQLHRQPRSACSHGIDVRPWSENFQVINP